MSTKKGRIYRSLCCLESTCIIRMQIQDLASFCFLSILKKGERSPLASVNDAPASPMPLGLK